MDDLRYLPKVKHFDFEQHIFDTWHVTKDLDMLFENICNSEREDIDIDVLSNIILGLKQLYDMRFNKLMDMYENLLHHRSL